MKKAVSILLAAVLILSLGIPAFAADVTENQGSASSPVTGTYVPGTAGGTVFSVEIEWSGLSFTYNGESKQEWDPVNLEYTGVATPEGWADSNATITVNNRSNTIITAIPSYEKADGYNNVGMSFGSEKLYVLSAEPTGDATTGEEKSGTISVKPTGKLPVDTKDATIGTITVTIVEFGDVTKQDLQDFLDFLADITPCETAEEVANLSSGKRYTTDKTLWVTLAEQQDILNYEFENLTQDERNQRYIELVVSASELEILVKE